MLTSRSSKWNFLALALAVIPPLFVIAATRQATEQPIQLTLSSVGATARVIEFSVTNTTAKNISAWMVHVYVNGEPFSGAGQDLYGADHYFRPSETVRASLSKPPLAESPEFRVSVIFDDQTAAGNEADIAEMFKRRAQERDQLKLWITRLRSLLTSAGPDLAVLRRDVEAIAADESAAVSPAVRTFAIDLKREFDQTAHTSEQRSEALRLVLAPRERKLQAAIEASERRR